MSSAENEIAGLQRELKTLRAIESQAARRVMRVKAALNRASRFTRFLRLVKCESLELTAWLEQQDVNFSRVLDDEPQPTATLRIQINGFTLDLVKPDGDGEEIVGFGRLYEWDTSDRPPASLCALEASPFFVQSMPDQLDAWRAAHSDEQRRLEWDRVVTADPMPERSTVYVYVPMEVVMIARAVHACLIAEDRQNGWDY